ncbi:MAG TPA: (2Fe-2S)-binding protein [Chloroflexota bacterium]|nr:(2Fe-2S)-binding protein [Chloroflexota bacterium]
MLDAQEAPAPLETLQTVELAFTLNGRPWRGTVPVEEVLLDLLRERAGLTGAKRSCESEVCGACTVLVDGQPISACSYLAFEAQGKAVTTVEGLAADGQLDPLQEAFVRNVGAQCGYCTAGQLLLAKALLAEHPAPSRDEIAHWMTNLCRCGAYPAIAASIQEAAAAYRARAAGGSRSAAP